MHRQKTHAESTIVSATFQRCGFTAYFFQSESLYKYITIFKRTETEIKILILKQSNFILYIVQKPS